MPKLLIVDDEATVLKALRRELRGTGWDVVAVNSSTEAIKKLDREQFAVVLSDFRMPERTGGEVLAAAMKKQPRAVRIILSGYTDPDALLECVNSAGIFRYLVKPWDHDELIETLTAALVEHNALNKNHALVKRNRLETDRESQRLAELARLESESPGLTKVEFGPEDTIVLDENYRL